MPVGEHEPIAVNPLGMAGVVLEEIAQRTWAMSAMPIGAPGCPDLARSTASIESARMQLASSRRVVIWFFVCGSKGDAEKSSLP